MGSQKLLEVENLCIRYGALTAVSSVSFSVSNKEVVGLVGESGAGKSATAKGIIGLLPPIARMSGSVRYRGEELVGASRARLQKARGAQIGYIFQDALTALDPVRTVGVQLVEALRVHKPVSKREAWQASEALLEELKIRDPRRVMNSYAHELSGGMRQRAIIALALIAEPEVIIADEVTSALDVTVQRKVLEILLRVCSDRGAGLIMITHDLGVVAQTCDRVIVLYGGIVAEDADVYTLFDHPRHPYTHALMRSMPRVGSDAPFEPIPGSAIQVFGELQMCPFHERCAKAGPDCSAKLPPVQTYGGSQFRCFHPVGLEQ
jgi:oligopeptide/dipeptide ABC transporter, ATP-binding protein, C-terminal domain